MIILIVLMLSHRLVVVNHPPAWLLARARSHRGRDLPGCPARARSLCMCVRARVWTAVERIAFGLVRRNSGSEQLSTSARRSTAPQIAPFARRTTSQFTNSAPTVHTRPQITPLTTTSQPPHNHLTTTSQPPHHLTTTSQPPHNHLTTIRHYPCYHESRRRGVEEWSSCGVARLNPSPSLFISLSLSLPHTHTLSFFLHRPVQATSSRLCRSTGR